MKLEIVNRLMQIVRKQKVTVETKDGPREDEVIADKNAIAASRVLITMEAQNQKDDHCRDGAVSSRSKPKPAAKAAPGNVQINQDPSPTIQEIIQEAIRSGACERVPSKLENERRETEPDQVTGDIRHQREPGTLGGGEPP